MSRVVFLLLFALSALPVRAQPAGDSLSAQGVPYFGASSTYAELLREYAQLQRLPEPEDTTTSDSPDAGIQRLEIDGLVVDETLTKLGRDFYDIFFRVWEPPEDAINFTIAIQEQPAPGNSTIVTVLVDDEPAFQARLQPRIEEIEAAAYQAVGVTRYRLSRRQAAVIY